MSISDNVKKTIDDIKMTNIYGCITGSSLITDDFDHWDETPDIDIFAYGELAFQHASDVCEYKLGYVPGVAGSNSQDKSQEWKRDRTITAGIYRKTGLATIKFKTPYDTTVNVSYRKNKENALDVITNFDMSIVMKAWDIRKEMDVDLRLDPIPEKMKEILKVDEPGFKIAVPSRYRDQDFALFTVIQWIRQFDRVIKYWNRGYDTRPMARFYQYMIDETLHVGKMFTSEKAEAYFNESMAEIIEVKTRIDNWLRSKEEI